MCGLVGAFSLATDKSLTQPIRRVRQSLHWMRHRGPDGQGITVFPVDGPVYRMSESDDEQPPVFGILGHCRLAIIDHNPCSSQPMSTSDGRYHLAFNGEIYNHQALRRTYFPSDTFWQTQSDTETVLKLFQAYGPRMLPWLNGMFALLIVDIEARTVFTARDRIGIKPLYWTITPDNTLAYASEIKGLLPFLGHHRQLNPQGLFQYLTFQNILTSDTLLDGVYTVPQATWRQWSLETGASPQEIYWHPATDECTRPITVDDAAVELRERLTQAIERQHMGEASVGSFLSGGLDTGTIAALGSRIQAGLPTFTCGFELPANHADGEQANDERPSARDLAKLLGTRHYNFAVGPSDFWDLLPQTVWYLDDLRVGNSVQHLAVSRLARQHVSVAFSGGGADELLAGYPWRHQRAFDTSHADFNAVYNAQWARLLDDHAKQNLFQSEFQNQLKEFSSFEAFTAHMAECPVHAPLEKALWFDRTTFLPGLLLVEDRLGLAASLESRFPFLDNDVIDVCQGLPPEFKLRDGQGKWILRKAMQGVLPDSAITRKKQGFIPPDASWFRGELYEPVSRLLTGPDSLTRDWFQPAQVQSILECHASGKENLRGLIWSLLCLEWWYRLFLTDTVTEPKLPTLVG